MIKSTVEDIRKEFKRLYDNEEFVISETGSKTIEIISADFIVPEADTAIFGKLNEYADREIQWYLSQSLSVLDIPGKCPKIWMDISTKDDKHEINSNYGWMVFSEANGNQYDNALKELIDNPESRRACHIYIRPSMWKDYCRDGMSDYVCTFAAQMFIRDNTLYYCVNMRSNDAVYGFKNDVYWARYVANKLIKDLNDNGVKVNETPVIHWHANSLHLYERDFHYITEYFG